MGSIGTVYHITHCIIATPVVKYYMNIKYFYLYVILFTEDDSKYIALIPIEWITKWSFGTCLTLN